MDSALAASGHTGNTARVGCCRHATVMVTAVAPTCYKQIMITPADSPSAPSIPDLADVLAARRRIAPYLAPTPLYRYPTLDALAGAQLWVKHENHQPVGA